MAAPASYSEESLAAFMLACLKDLAAAMDWSSLADVQEAVNETLLAYGVDNIAAANDVRKLRALARVEVWRQVVAATTGDYDFSADGGQYSRSQVNEQARAALAAAQTDAAEYDAAYCVEVTPIVWKHDPYLVAPDNERSLP